MTHYRYNNKTYLCTYFDNWSGPIGLVYLIPCPICNSETYFKLECVKYGKAHTCNAITCDGCGISFKIINGEAEIC